MNNETVVLSGALFKTLQEAVEDYRKNGKYFAKFEGVDEYDETKPLYRTETNPNNLAEKIKENAPTIKAQKYISELLDRQGIHDSYSDYSELEEYQRGRYETLKQKAVERAREMESGGSDSFFKSLDLAARSGWRDFTNSMNNFGSGGEWQYNYLDDAFLQAAAEQRAEMNTATGVVYDFVSNLSNNAVSSIAGQAFKNPIVGSALSFASAYGRDLKYAKQAGHDDKKAYTYAFLDGLNQGALDYFTSLIPGVGTFSDKVRSAIGKKISSAVLRFLSTSAVTALSETGQEMVQTSIENGLKNWVLGEETDVSLLSEESLYSGFLGGLTALLLGAPANVSVSTSQYSVPSTKRKNLTESQLWVSEKFSKLKGGVNVKGLGMVTLDADSMADAIHKTKNTDQAVAFAAIRDILRKGNVSKGELGTVALINTGATLNGNMHPVAVSVQKKIDGGWRLAVRKKAARLPTLPS